jgi:uncharacterized membrane protein SpoIIM required for sporulation
VPWTLALYSFVPSLDPHGIIIIIIIIIIMGAGTRVGG